MTKAVCLSRVCRYFGTVKALDGVDLQVEDGEFFGLLGPSGSGKTTCLRIIAGFDSPTSGEIEIAGRRSESVPPYRRDVSTVFQDYALFPHMDVVTNVAYGLMVRGVNKTERIARAREALALVKLSGYDERRPSELSGGQRQRVALARSIVTQPSVLLLDEPLGALDLKLREQMQAELKSLQRELGITFVFVTHDQSEALSMSDRIAIFDDGQIRQIGTPQEIYERPANAFVANFVGGSNVVDTRMIPGIPGEQGSYSLRPEKITIGPGPADAVTLKGKISEVQYQGATYRISIDLGESSLTTVQPVDGDEQFTPGDSITVWFHRRHLHPMTVN